MYYTPFWVIVISDEPAVCVIDVPKRSGLSLKTRGVFAVVVWLLESTVASTSGVPPVPGSPLGITKSNTASSLVPEFVTSASVPGSPVVTVPIVIVAAVPWGPSGPSGPSGP